MALTIREGVNHMISFFLDLKECSVSDRKKFEFRNLHDCQKCVDE